MTPRLSVVIPAHNEGALVRRTIERLLDGAGPNDFEIVVAANGCTDDTAAQAAAVPGVRVVEIERPSKIAALNAGDAATDVFPRAYIDADVTIDSAALHSVADVLTLTEGPLIAAPRLVVDDSRSTWSVRAYYRVWAMSEYRATGHVGSGVYAVNRAGRERWGRFPELIADDRFVQSRFRESERITIGDRTFTVLASRDMGTHVRRGVRIELGNRQLRNEAQLSDAEPAPDRYAKLLKRVAAHPSLWPSFACYAYGFGMIKARSRGRGPATVAWERDESLRDSVRG